MGNALLYLFVRFDALRPSKLITSHVGMISGTSTEQRIMCLAQGQNTVISPAMGPSIASLTLNKAMNCVLHAHWTVIREHFKAVHLYIEAWCNPFHSCGKR